MVEPTASSTPTSALRAVGSLFQPFAPAFIEDPAAAFYLPAHAQAPVAYSEAFSAYLITGYAEVMTVLRDPVLFSSAKGLEPPVPWPAEVIEVLRRGVFPLPPALFNNDPPGHTRARALFSKAFTSARIAELNPTIEATAAELIEAMAHREAPEVMRDFAYPLPMRIIASLVGVPAADAWRLKAGLDAWFKFYEPSLGIDEKLKAAEGFVDLARYYLDVIERRQKQPADDFVTALLQARHEDDAPLSQEEIVSHLVILFGAGYETTASLIGSAMLRLLSHPERWAAIGENPDLLQAMLEETVRLDGPVQMEFRDTTAPAVVGGVEIPEGAKMFIFFGGANYDAGVFLEPKTFDPSRPELNRHMGFGSGIHKCIGARLARQEAMTAVAALRAAFPRMRLAEGARPSYLPHLLFRTPAAVPVVLDAG